MSIYQARFNRYLEDRNLKKPSTTKVWAFLGDGETDEPETLGAITLASREKLDNLIFVINCNLQRLDGPVRGNGQIIQELEALFTGAGWNVIKVLWGSDWDPLFALDTHHVAQELDIARIELRKLVEQRAAHVHREAERRIFRQRAQERCIAAFVRVRDHLGEVAGRLVCVHAEQQRDLVGLRRDGHAAAAIIGLPSRCARRYSRLGRPRALTG